MVIKSQYSCTIVCKSWTTFFTVRPAFKGEHNSMRSRSHFRRSGAIAKESFFQGGGDYRLTDFVAKGNRTCCMHPLPGSSIRLINIKDSPICLTISINSKLHLLSSYQNKATCLASNISKVLISQLNILSIISRNLCKR